MGSLVGLLVALSIVLALFWRLETLQTPTAILVFLTGALAFSIIPGMQTRVLVTAKDAPTLGIALNASGFQIAAAFSAWLGGQIIGSELGLDFVPLAGALVTAAGGLLAFGCWMRERPSTGQFLSQRCG
ncbi:MAG: MFS transporter [Steroidobacteraceae bacterium]|nr:MFS transporter [Steroidobacteraceae bacterium]